MVRTDGLGRTLTGSAQGGVACLDFYTPSCRIPESHARRKCLPFRPKLVPINIRSNLRGCCPVRPVRCLGESSTVVVPHARLLKVHAEAAAWNL